jgi:hypothetical protein
MQWITGLTFSLVIGHIVTWLFLLGLRHALRLGEKPSLTDGRKRVPPWLTGVTERLFFTVLIGVEVSGAPAAMVGWLALKLATNWNHPDWKDKADARTFALSALLAGLVSMMLALIGGLICAGKLSFGICI